MRILCLRPPSLFSVGRSKPKMANNCVEPISADELKTLGKALKDDKFRQLLLEYADEIRDPQNRKKYEQELSILERERGVDLTFVHPEAGFVLKTTTVDGTKTFVNICKNKNVGKPSCSRSKTKPGLDWSVPYFLSPPRDDVDKSGRKCRLFDVVFHPDTTYMAQRNARFYKMIEDTALEGIQQKFSVSLDRKNVHYPKLKYKGHPFPTVLRKPVTDAAVSELSEKLENANFSTTEKCDSLCKVNNSLSPENEKNMLNNASQEPKYSIRYRNKLDMEDFTYLAQQNANLRPDEMVIDIQLPFSDSAKDVDLDVIEQTLVLKSTGTVNYKLELPLPYPVNDDQGKAQFNQSQRTLSVTLPICPFENSTASKTETVPAVKSIEGKIESSHRCMMGNLCLPSHAYDLPNFEVNQTDHELTFLFRVPKVHSESVETQICDCGHGFQLIFTSTADTNWYSFCMISDNVILMNELQSDISEKNMVLRVSKNQCTEWEDFSYGCYEAVGDVFCFNNGKTILRKFEELKNETAEYLNKAAPIENEHVQVKEITEESLKMEIRVSDASSFSCEADTEDDPYDPIEVPRKTRSSSSESSQDLCPLPSRRGILKYPRNWRSISESSDDFNCLSSLDTPTPSPEDEECLLSAERIPKKNVRFSEHVAKNIFRANSSILGQKKKNQKRAEYKKRVAHRSSSQEEESESHDSTATTEEDTEHVSTNGKLTAKPKKKKNRSKVCLNNDINKNNSFEKCSEDTGLILDALVIESNKKDIEKNDNQEKSDNAITEEVFPFDDDLEQRNPDVRKLLGDTQSEAIEIEVKVEEESLGNVQGTECDADSVLGERTTYGRVFDLDFRTNTESVIHLMLSPENTAFHLD